MFDATRYRLTLTEAIPHPLLFASVSGAHLYGFPSPDSDVDLRADPRTKAWWESYLKHVIPFRKVKMAGIRAASRRIPPVP